MININIYKIALPKQQFFRIATAFGVLFFKVENVIDLYSVDF